MIPTGKYILIEPIQESKLITPKRRRKSTSKGVVLAVSDYVKDIEVNNIVYFNLSGGKKTEDGLLLPLRSINLIK